MRQSTGQSGSRIGVLGVSLAFALTAACAGTGAGFGSAGATASGPIASMTPPTTAPSPGPTTTAGTGSASPDGAGTHSPPAPVSTPTPSAGAPIPLVRAGAAAYVGVTVATGWHSSTSARPVDAPALANPVRMDDWLRSMTLHDQAGLIGRVDTQLLLGDRVDVLEISGGWAHVVAPAQVTPIDARGYPVWVPLGQLTAVGPPAASVIATVVVRSAWLKTPDGAPRLQATFGTTLPVVDQRQPGIELGLPGGQRLWVDAAEVAVHQVGTPALPGTGATVIESARLFLGRPYVWGGTSGFGVDCSGLVYLVYRVHGTELPRDAEPQSAIGTSVALSALRPGDLVFFARDGAVHHVAIWMGEGQIMEAPQVGVPVRVVALASLSYASELSIARRVLSPAP